MFVEVTHRNGDTQWINGDRLLAISALDPGSAPARALLWFGGSDELVVRDDPATLRGRIHEERRRWADHG
jgi:hypothetical protein